MFLRARLLPRKPRSNLKVWEGGLPATVRQLTSYCPRFSSGDKKKLFFEHILVVVTTIPVSLIRLGNFFNSELVGRQTDGPWGVVFSRVDDLTRHPSQLYEFGMGSLLFAIIFPLWLKKHKTAKPGFFFGLFFTLYFALRFTVEFFKDFPLHESFFSLTTGQMLSLPFFILGLVFLLRSTIGAPK